MISKKILVVSSSFYPEISPRAFRTTELVKELAKQGHQVTLYTLKNEAVHSRIETDWAITIKDLGKLKFGSINTHHSNKWVSLCKRGLNRILLMLFEYPNIELLFKVNKALSKEEDYDLLISIAVPYPIHWGVAKAIKKNTRLTKIWIADCGDPYMGEKLDSFRKLFYFKYIEQNFCRLANYITVPTEGSKQGYYPEFHHKIKVIPQGFDFEQTAIYKGEIKNEVPTFAYAGSFIPGIRDPREFLQFLVNQHKPFKFILYTNNSSLVAPFVEASRNQIEIKNYIPRAELLYELSKMDFLVNFPNGTAMQTPSKLIDYAITRRPILNVITGNLREDIVNQFLEGEYQQQLIMGDMEQYNIKNVARQFVALS